MRAIKEPEHSKAWTKENITNIFLFNRIIFDLKLIQFTSIKLLKLLKQKVEVSKLSECLK